MKRTTQPEKKKSPRTRRTGSGAKGRRKAGAPAKKTPAPIKSAPRKSPPALLIAAWLAAVAVLVSIIYLSGDSGKKSVTTVADSGQKAETKAKTPLPTRPPQPSSAPGKSVVPPPNDQAPSKAKRAHNLASVAANGSRQVTAPPVQSPTPAPTVKKTEAPPSRALVPVEPDRTQHHSDATADRQAPAPRAAGTGSETGIRPGKSLPPVEKDKSRSGEPFSVALNKPAPSVPAPPPLDLKPKPTSRVAIIIDDFGPDLEIAKKFVSLPFHVSLSVLPHQLHSREIVELAHARGRETLLHLPMEPLRYPKENPGKGAVLLAMSRDDIQRNVRTALDAFPYISGVNNHMGSRITQNAEVMKTVLAEVSRRNLFFVDSWTTPESKGWKTAQEMKVPSRKRDIFLDHSLSPSSIRMQIRRLIRLARLQGSALAIGHPHEVTFKALRESAAQFRKEGIEVVAARDLVGW